MLKLEVPDVVIIYKDLQQRPNENNKIIWNDDKSLESLFGIINNSRLEKLLKIETQLIDFRYRIVPSDDFRTPKYSISIDNNNNLYVELENETYKTNINFTPPWPGF